MPDEADPADHDHQSGTSKLLYFAHSIFLIEGKRALVSGYFEAWQNGPVHPAAYAAFETTGRARSFGLTNMVPKIAA